jgi:hypothetical protein
MRQPPQVSPEERKKQEQLEVLTQEHEQLAFKKLPSGSREVWDHCIHSLYEAEQSSSNENTMMFTFTREMMRFSWTSEWRDDPERIADLLEKIHRQGGGSYFWDDCGDEFGFELTREEFVAIWISMRFPPGMHPLVVALHDARKAPLIPRGPSSRAYRLLISVAGHLQMRAGDRDIALPQSRLAELLEISQTGASLYLGLAVRNRILRVTRWHNRAAKQAKEYRFDLELFDLRSGKQV